MSPAAVIVADGGPDVGLGHLARSSAVARALADRSFDTRCLANGATAQQSVDGVEWEPFGGEAVGAAAVVVADSYELDPAALAGDTPLVLMHDRGEASAAAALVIAPADPAEPTATRLSGLEFACLRPAFWELARRRHEGPVRVVLVTTGGGDPRGLAATLAETARDALPSAEVRLVRGPQSGIDVPDGVRDVRANPLLDELLGADLVVSGAGQTMLEAAAAGTPCVAIPLVDNQRAQAERLAGAGAVELVEPDAIGGLGRLLVDLGADPERRNRMSDRSQSLVDGRGALRVAERIAALVEHGA